ncbi:4-carboxymuconolactone decarboxylase [Nitrospirillum viridazoti]|uniref:4-carboxymuconolactone decarboxylase n=1 Tax=Nitrospirillum viridazoti CBAmc TaxID=1441467 RepID=A0A248JZJ8_9PROT|nr:4-carboxymuconolactone decarboxylase [Nitrospirillum amazonense]ASG23901.1 4-carboxymuconolactone decarboxylase [Nitrospirillum amazonense CBAmc]TWB44667.1 4-carboxymuconolactone decarboxylase [Nitrospirillum amazonense]
MDEQDRFDLGLATRKSVLGEAHVDRALAGRTEFNTEFQDLITRYAWGEIWTRPAIDHPTRRLLTLAMMIALNRGEEFKMHVRAALQHGVSKDLIKEVILQSAIYCGVPAANTAFHQAAEVFAGLDAAGA